MLREMQLSRQMRNTKNRGTNHTKNGGPRKKAKAKLKYRNKRRDKQTKRRASKKQKQRRKVIYKRAKQILQKNLRLQRDGRGKDSETLRSSLETRVTDPSADAVCSGNREPALTCENAGTESGIKAVKQKADKSSGNKRRNHKRSRASTLRRK